MRSAPAGGVVVERGPHSLAHLVIPMVAPGPRPPPDSRAFGHVVPQAWAMDAFVKLIYDHESLGAVLPEIAVPRSLPPS